MKRQAVIFAVETENGVVNRIGKAYIAIRKSDFGAARLFGWMINSKYHYTEGK